MNYVRNAWYVAAWANELAPGTPSAIRILDDPIVLYRTERGRLVALEDRCVHRLAPLSLGRCEGERLRCMYHGLLFEPDGRVAEIPGQDVVPAQARVRRYAVAEKHSWIWVWMGEADTADEALIPNAVGLDHPDYILGHGHLDYAAEARLINDNLLDFSHLSYVHANSFGASEDWARDRPKITMLPRGIRFERWVPAQSGFRSGGGPPVDAWSTYDFLLPGILLMPSASYPAGTAEKCGFAPPDPALPASGVTFTSQAVTPLTDKTSRYFFSWGPRRDCGDEAMRDMLMGVAAMAFGEDKVMIEAQQRVIDTTPDPRIMPIGSDKGVVLFNRLVDRMVREEREGARAAA
ncbi:MAG: aromatic ring-hydroxylating dioxygenase subunit alpha [Sphingomonas bacterium]|nr:aromatic ring-hydroxylating dioxygenase subunit alpha [Sphingomonas bacterium]